MAEGQEIAEQISVPLDAEQQAAKAGVVTQTQKRANEAMGKNVANAMQTKLDERLVDDRGVHLQRGFEAVQRKAKDARDVGTIPTAGTVQEKPVKKGILRKLLGF